MTNRKDTSDPRPSLEQLGWRASFEQAMAPFRQEGLVPARVIAFQRAEFLVEHGMVDFIVERSQMREVLISCLQFMTPGRAKSPSGVRAREA